LSNLHSYFHADDDESSYCVSLLYSGLSLMNDHFFVSLCRSPSKHNEKLD